LSLVYTSRVETKTWTNFP